jgi:hypothetical protein
MKGYWLPEDYVLKLTALELGALTAIVSLQRESDFPVNKPGPDGKPIETTMRALLLEKLIDCANFHGKSAEPNPVNDLRSRVGLSRIR